MRPIVGKLADKLVYDFGPLAKGYICCTCGGKARLCVQEEIPEEISGTFAGKSGDWLAWIVAHQTYYCLGCIDPAIVVPLTLQKL